MNGNAKTQNAIIKKETAVFCLVLLAAFFLFWWRVWIPSPSDRMHFTDDIFIKDYATRIGLFSIAVSGHLPLWDPYQFGGWPGIANCEAGFFYPPNWLIAPFLSDPQSAFFMTEILVMLHMVFAGLGAFQLARSLGLSVYSSAMAGIAFTFCGFHCAHKKHTNMLFALVWFPWILLCLEYWLCKQNAKYLIYATVCLALSFFAGHPQSALYMSLILFARMIYAGMQHDSSRKISTQSIFAHTSICLFIILLAFCLSAVQWLPTAELIGESARAAAGQYQRSAEFSLPPQELVDAFLPEALAPWHQTEVFYWGITPLALSLLCFIFPINQWLLRFLLYSGIAALFLSLGENFFLYDVTYVLVPGTAWVRAPSRWIYFSSLPIAIGAGYVLDHFKSYRKTNGKILTVWLKPVWIIWCGLFFFVMAWNVLQPAKLDEAGTIRYLIQKQSVLLVLFLGLSIATLYAYLQNRISHFLMVSCLILITWVDLATQYHKLDLAPGAGGYTALEEPDKTLITKHRTKVFLQDGGDRTKYHGAAQLFRELDGQSPLTPLIHLEVRSDTALHDPSKPNEALLRLFGVNTVILDQPGSPQPFINVSEQLYTLPGEFARARVMPEVFHVQTSFQRQLLSLQSFPYERVVMMDLSSAKWADSYPPSIVSPYISKPFLLSGASSNAVKSGVHLIIDGVDYFSDLKHKTGYAVAVIDPLSAKVETVDSFDLPSTEPQEGLPDTEWFKEQIRMQKFIDAVPNGKTVMAVVLDNGANNLGIQGVHALHQIGVSSDLRQAPLRTAHLVIGKKGNPVGSAIEIVSPTETMILQTDKHFYHNGIILKSPKLSINTSIMNVPDLLRFYQKEFHVDSSKFNLQTNVDLQQKKSPIPFIVYSSPKKDIATTTRFQPFTADSSSIQIDGKEYSLNQTGYNLVVADPVSFEIKDSAGFNLMSDYDAVKGVVKNPMEANLSMQAYLQSVKEGDLIFGTIRDEATALLSQDTLDILHSMGSKLDVNLQSTDDTIRKNYSHAFLMVKGTSTCIEAFGRHIDALLYTRYPGGPRLLDLDLTTLPDGSKYLYQPFDTYHEIITEASRTLDIQSLPSGTEWLVEENGPDELTIAGNSNGGILFVNEIFYPGWKIYIDSVEAPLHRLNYFFRGVKLEPGYHEVKMKYAPESFYSGALISFFSLILLTGWIIRQRYIS